MKFKFPQEVGTYFASSGHRLVADAEGFITLVEGQFHLAAELVKSGFTKVEEALVEVVEEVKTTVTDQEEKPVKVSGDENDEQKPLEEAKDPAPPSPDDSGEQKPQGTGESPASATSTDAPATEAAAAQ